MNKLNVLVLASLVILIIYGKILIPTVHVANDLHTSTQETLAEHFSFPFSWGAEGGTGLGEYAVSVLWAYPIHLVFGIFGYLGFSFNLLLVILGVIPFLIIGIFGIYKLLNHYGLGKTGKFVGIIFYLVNSYILLLVDGGQLNLATAYSLLPLCFYLYLKVLEEKKIINAVFFALGTLALSIFDIRIVYFLALLILLKVIFCLFEKTFLKDLKTNFLIALITGLILLGFHSYWIVPSVFLRPPSLPLTYDRSSQVDFLSFSSLGHSIFLQQPHWYKNVFGDVTNVKLEFLLIPLLVFLSPVLIRKNKNLSFWLMISIISIILTKGSQPPWENIYTFLFENIPGFTLFRDPVKFYFLLCLSYSVLIAFTFDFLSKINLKNNLLNNSKKYFPLFFILYLLFLNRPVFLNQFTGMFSFPRFLSEYQSLENYLRSDNNFSRVLWIPTKAPLGYSSIIHPGVEASRLSEKRPFAIGTVGNYELFNFLRESPFIGQILDVSGVGYIAYPMIDPMRRVGEKNDDLEYYDKFLNQLENLPWVEKRVNESGVPLLKVKNNQDKFFKVNNLSFIVGSDDIYKDSTKSADLNLSKNAYIFTEERPGILEKINSFPSAKVILNNKTEIDLLASLFKQNEIFFPSKDLKTEPDFGGFWKRETADLVWLKDFLNTKYEIPFTDFDLGGGYAISEGEHQLNIKNSNLKKERMLFARVLGSSKSGSLRFNQENNLIGQIETKISSNSSNLRWFKIGELKENEHLNIQTTGDINIINALAFINKKDLENYQNKTAELDNKLTSDIQSSTNSAQISYQRINPTKYKVRISNLTQPTFFVFAENYDPFWKLDGKEPIPVYSLLNGYEVDRNGEYILEYEPQKYVYKGLVITVLTIGAVIFFFVFYLLRKSSSLRKRF